VDTVCGIAVLASLNRRAAVLCLRGVEPDATGEHARIHNTPDDDIVAQNRLLAKARHDATHQLDLRWVSEKIRSPLYAS
jgi:hypothetical protein